MSSEFFTAASATTDSNSTCSNGLAGVEDTLTDICCTAACGQCGGEGCGSIPGLSNTDCCSATIEATGSLCSVTGSAPCIVDPPGRSWFSNYLCVGLCLPRCMCGFMSSKVFDRFPHAQGPVFCILKPIVHFLGDGEFHLLYTVSSCPFNFSGVLNFMYTELVHFKAKSFCSLSIRAVFGTFLGSCAVPRSLLLYPCHSYYVLC